MFAILSVSFVYLFLESSAVDEQPQNLGDVHADVHPMVVHLNHRITSLFSTFWDTISLGSPSWDMTLRLGRFPTDDNRSWSLGWSSAEDMFLELDEDGSGELTMEEIATWLAMAMAALGSNLTVAVLCCASKCP